MNYRGKKKLFLNCTRMQNPSPEKLNFWSKNILTESINNRLLTVFEKKGYYIEMQILQ